MCAQLAAVALTELPKRRLVTRPHRRRHRHVLARLRPFVLQLHRFFLS
jgi:hypothetical protein